MARGGAVWSLGQDGCVQIRAGADVQHPPVHIHSAGPDGLRGEKGDIKEVGEGHDQIPGYRIQILLDPVGVLQVVVVAKFQEGGGGPHPAHLPDGGGSLGPHQAGQGVDGF